MRRAATLAALALAALSLAAGPAAAQGKRGKSHTSPRSGVRYVRIPGGAYKMGSTLGDKDELPVHRVKVPSFFIGKAEVTVGQYRDCVEARKCTVPDSGAYCNWGKVDRHNHPVNCLDWYQARAFCAWDKGRLPSEAEWEFVARSRGKKREYTWGNKAATCTFAVMDDARTKGSVGAETDGCGENHTWPVCSRPRGNAARGVCDMAGNVFEWVEDCWHPKYGGAPADGSAWIADCNGKWKCNRGGAWNYDKKAQRASVRYGNLPKTRNNVIGFRCAR